ncbi:MAG: hypothetical protein H0U57_05065 [Tatlockia sp.]|nr:hypothetical protein [Tatlockia sp.]
MNNNLKIYFETAKKLKLPVKYLDSQQCLKISLGKKNYYFIGTITPFNSSTSIFITKNKQKTLQLFRKSGFPVLNHIAISKDSNWRELLPQHVASLQFPVVLKPTFNSSNRIGIIGSIKTSEHLFDHLESNFKHYSHLQIEEFYQGLKEYRVLILKNRTLAVVERIAAHIVGDGIQTIQELADRKVNAECLICLADQGLKLENVVPAGKMVRLYYSANRSLGGISVSLGKKINSENANYLLRAAKITGLDLVGIDLLCEDINLPFSQTKWLIIEANFSPGILIHEYPDKGKSLNVSKKILRQLIVHHPFAYIYQRIKRMFRDG